MTINSLFDAVKMPDAEREAGVSGVYSERSKVYKTVSGRTKTVSDADLIRFWYTKQAENGVSDRWRREKVLVFLILSVVVVLSAYAAVDFRLTAVAVLALLSFGVAADPLLLLRRKLSRYSRLIVGLSILPVIVIAMAATLRTVIIAVIFMTAAFLVAIIGNRHWRAVESYKMSRHVLKALQPDDNTDHRDACLTAWQADGAREVVAAAAEMGAYGCAEIEWQVRKAAYTIGFCRASAITKKWTAERAKEQRKLAKLEAENAELSRLLDAAADHVKNYKTHVEKLQAAEDQAARGVRAELELAEVKAENQKLAAENARLSEANAELIKTADNPLLAEEVAEQMTEKRLKEARDLGLSVRQTAAYAGVSHSRAQKYLKEHRKKEGEE